MPGLEKTSGKVSYGASGQNATKGNTKKRVRGQEKKRSRRKGKEQAQRSEIAVKLNQQIKSEIYNVVASAHINEAKLVLKEGKELRIINFLIQCGIPKHDMSFTNQVLVFDKGMKQATKAKDYLMTSQSPLNAGGKKGMRQHYDKILWMGKMNESPKHRPMKISRKEWKKTPLNYRSFIKGKPYMLKNNKGSTELVPVEIVN